MGGSTIWWPGKTRTNRASSAFVAVGALLGIKPIGRNAEHIIALDADAVQNGRFGRRSGTLFLFRPRAFGGIHDGGILPWGACRPLNRGRVSHPGWSWLSWPGSCEYRYGRGRAAASDEVRSHRHEDEGKSEPSYHRSRKENECPHPLVLSRRSLWRICAARAEGRFRLCIMRRPQQAGNCTPRTLSLRAASDARMSGGDWAVSGRTVDGGKRYRRSRRSRPESP